MSHHRKGDYTQVFKAILDSLPNEANLEDVVCDFEAAIWQAVKECMPDVHLHGCHFHWCQAVYRKTTWFQSATWDVVNWCNFKKLVRTNNDADGWHRRLNTRAGGSSVTIYKLLKDVLRKDSS
ncbi:hypothetical protein E2C01_102288 [Portunus trituberculatus]|uniref:Uncharacterized protein n=1 Tax=Portunus trituberculatus TaxID=210409 RepID=A0A5B7KHZ4_PORTR|nr:hypothetical protein [Portunus trituberculatus]